MQKNTIYSKVDIENLVLTFMSLMVIAPRSYVRARAHRTVKVHCQFQRPDIVFTPKSIPFQMTHMQSTRSSCSTSFGRYYAITHFMIRMQTRRDKSRSNNCSKSSD